jgi:hypothetical protein
VLERSDGQLARLKLGCEDDRALQQAREPFVAVLGSVPV